MCACVCVCVRVRPLGRPALAGLAGFDVVAPLVGRGLGRGDVGLVRGDAGVGRVDGGVGRRLSTSVAGGAG